MIQLFPLRIFYLLFTSLLMLFEVFPENLSFMRVLKVRISRRKPVRISLMVAGMVLGILVLFMPVYPGPVILGDLLPAVALVFSAFHYHGDMAIRDEMPIIDSYWEYGGFRHGIINLVIAALDLLFPSFILL